jgi:hypothetical protein
MITIINERNGHKEEFKNYQKLYNHINNHQWSRRYEQPHHLIDDWFFACHSRHRIMAFYEFCTMQSKPLKFDFLEMSYDKPNDPVILPITPNLDIEKLRKDWCQRYCAFHGYQLVEAQDDGGMLHIKRNPHQPSTGEDGS